MKRLLLLVGASCLFAGLSSAGIAFVLQGPPVFNGTDYTWSYNAYLNGGEGIGYAGTQSYFTLYDFAGFDSVGPLAAGWTVTEQLTGLTPASQALINDDGGVLNITFYYNGPQSNGPQSPVLAVNLFSSIGTASPGGGVYAYQTNGQDLNGGYSLLDQGQGQAAIPLATPEPATMGLIGAGAIVLAMLRRKRTP